MAKVVKAGMVQTNVRLSEFSDQKLKALAKEADVTIGAFIEKMLDSYSEPSKPSNLASGVSDDWRSAVAELSSRVMALESRSEELMAVGKVSMPQVEKMPVVADLTPSVVAVDAGGETPVVEQGAGNKSLGDWENAVIAMYKAGTTNYQHIADQTYAAGFQNSNGKQRDRSFVKKVLDKAGKVG